MSDESSLRQDPQQRRACVFLFQVNNAQLTTENVAELLHPTPRPLLEIANSWISEMDSFRNADLALLSARDRGPGNGQAPPFLDTVETKAGVYVSDGFQVKRLTKVGDCFLLTVSDDLMRKRGEG